MKKNPNPCLLLLAALLPACLAGPARAQSTHAFNSGMNCCGVWTLPDTSTQPYNSATVGDDEDYQPAISSPSYTNNGNGTVTDKVTGLMWIRSPGSSNHPWSFALSSCTATTAGGMNYGAGFAGYTDWRLPNVRELMSIVDYGVAVDPFISDSSFPNTATQRFWTSTTYMLNTAAAWTVDFSSGTLVNDDKVANKCIRCVRGGQ